ARSRPAATYPGSTAAWSPQPQALALACSWCSGVRTSVVLYLLVGSGLVGGFGGADDRGVHPVGGLMGELHARTREPRLGETVEVFGLGEGSGDAADVGAAFGSLFGGEAVFGDDIGDPDPPAGGEHAEHLGEHGGLLRGEVDDAAGDQHNHR